jgi:hypothetical protein
MPVIDRHRYTVGWKFGYPTQKRSSEHPYEELHEFENKVFLRVYQPREDDLNDLEVDLNNVDMDIDEL